MYLYDMIASPLPPPLSAYTAGYMLEPDLNKRPNIWQVAEVAFRISKLQNTIKNVFHSQAPPSSLPAAPRAQNKTTPLQSKAAPKATAPKTAAMSKELVTNPPQHPGVVPTLSTPTTR